MPWVFLIAAGLLEIFWATSMKLSHSFSKTNYTILTILLMIASFSLLSLSMKYIPLGTAYMIWTGIGAIGTFMIGIVYFGDVLSPVRIFAALLIISGLVLIKISS